MKIRCKNCYRVLNQNEEYCTNCGEHSADMEKAMKTGHYENGVGEKLKIALIFYCFVAIIGNGIFRVIFGLIQKKINVNYQISTDVFGQANSLLVTSAALLCLLLIFYRKELKTMIFQGTIKQLLGSLFIGFMFVGIVVMLSKLTDITRVVPNFMIESLTSDRAAVEGTGAFQSILALIFIVISEEIVFRRRLIDAFDEGTMFGDITTIIITGVIATCLDFLWLMTVETLIISFVLNILMSAIYVYTNRSLGINILIRILLVVLVFII